MIIINNDKNDDNINLRNDNNGNNEIYINENKNIIETVKKGKC